MCGLFGHIGSASSIPECLKGLKKLQYRGYDSAGIAGFEKEGTILCIKEKGQIQDLEKALADKLDRLHATIGHTRWATHGGVTQLNAHPHLDQTEQIAVVHNGIIENHHELRLYLKKKGYTFVSETDTEVVAQLISHHYSGDILQAVCESMSLMKGFWGLAIIHKDHPDQIIAVCKENPIVIGLSKDKTEAFVASDPHSFASKDVDHFFLNTGEIALISKNDVMIFDFQGNSIQKTPRPCGIKDIDASKGNYEHYMLKEIYDQPQSIRNALDGRIDREMGTVQFEEFSLSQQQFEEIDHILILGCGSSWHAGLIGALQIEEFVGKFATCEIASEFRYRKSVVGPKTLVIAISQSGETFDTIAAVKKAKEQGAMTLCITNVTESTLTREADYCIDLKAGPEFSVCSTKAFSCQLTILSLLTLYLGRLGPLNLADGHQFIDQLINLPTLAHAALEESEEIKKWAKTYAKRQNFFFLGRQYMVPTADEAALKLKEISYLNALSYPSGELKHGPIALIDPDCLVIGLCDDGPLLEKILSNLSEVKAREGQIVCLATKGTENIDQVADSILWLPKLHPALMPIIFTIPLQLFAYYMAQEKGTCIDRPRNLAKSVTVE